MAFITLAGRWRVFFYIELFLMGVTGMNWMFNSDSMYTVFGYPDESDVFSDAHWQPSKPVTGQHFAALTAGQILCLSYSYVLLRTLLASKIETSGFRYVLEAMTIGDIAQVYIAALTYANGIVAVRYTDTEPRQLTTEVISPAMFGVVASSSFATFFGIMRFFFLLRTLPDLEKGAKVE